MLQPHAVLQIKPNSSEEDVKAAYKRRALETHPDKGGDVAEFRAVRLAYEQLTKDSASSGPAPARESGGPQQQKSGGVAPFPRGFEDLFAGFAAPPPSRLRGDARKRRRRTLEESIDEAFAAIPIPVYRPRPASPRPPPPRRQPPDSPATPQKSTTATRPPKAASAQQPRAAPKAPAPTPVAQMWAKLLSLDPEKRKKAIGNLPATAKQQLKDYLQALKARQTNDSSSSSSEGGGSSSSSSSDSEGDSSAAPPSSGLGALVAMSALAELRPMALDHGTVPVLALISPGFQFARFISDQSGVSCGLNSTQCARQPLAQCARAPIAFTPTGETQKLDYLSRWFPKMIVTEPVDPDLVCRDPQAAERMARDHLIWRQGYRARVLSEIVEAQHRLVRSIEQHGEDFQCPTLILHGSGDKLYSVQGSIGIHSAWCQGIEIEATALVPRLKIYDGAYHQLLNEPNKDEVMNDIVNFVLSSLTGY